MSDSIVQPNYFILNSPEDIQECSCEEYFEWQNRQDDEDKTVLGIRLEYDVLPNGVIISTIFTGDDSAGYIQDGPLLYETRVADPHGHFAFHTVRAAEYYTALNYHIETIEQIKKHYKIESKKNAALS